MFVCCVCGRGCSARQVEDLPPPPHSLVAIKRSALTLYLHLLLTTPTGDRSLSPTMASRDPAGPRPARPRCAAMIHHSSARQPQFSAPRRDEGKRGDEDAAAGPRPARPRRMGMIHHLSARPPQFSAPRRDEKCPKNHTLRRGVATDGMWCDLCGAEQQRGAQLFGCHAESQRGGGDCDYDLCRRCVDAGTRRTGGARENWKAGFQGEWGDAFRKIKVTVNQLDDADEEVTVEWVG